MSEAFFEIKNCSVTGSQIMAEIQRRIKEKEDQGIYQKYSLSRSVQFEWKEVSDETQFLDYYLKTIRRSWAVDINEFEIPKKKGLKGKIELLFKKIIWKSLKFYTYRLFSQQREFNSQAAHTLLLLHQDYTEKIKKLETELKAVEKTADTR
ncbi:MAG: hypothetical protein JW774_02480 [Candidatus Aureabacteria bacterium]|nr:hypothetical protein [Candidatus Auribacterota bacterium]